MTTSLRSRFGALFGRSPTLLLRSPGRVNLLGAHVDTHEGWVLPAAIERSIWLAAAPRSDGALHLRALDLDAGADLALDSLPRPLAERDGSPGSWIDLPAGVAWALSEAGFHPIGLDVAFGGDLPIGAGVSSSAALEIAFILAWERLSGFELPMLERARLGRRVENDYLGLGSGIMDQYACLHGAADRALLLDCRSLTHEMLSISSSCAVLVADSGVRRRLTEVGFDDRRLECRSALDRLRTAGLELSSLRDLRPGELDAHRHLLSEAEERRTRHVVEECRRVLAGAEALRRGDLEKLGTLMVHSHASSRDLYEVSIPELDNLAATAAAEPGCFGARLTGGGFGGCVTALVETAATDAVRASMEKGFAARFGRRPDIFVTGIGDGAELVE